MLSYKKLILAATVMASLGVPAMAADSDLIEIMRSDIRTEKMAIVTKAMQLSEAQSTAFWPVYKEYEAEMIKLNDERIAIIKDYAAAYDSMAADTAKSLINRSFKLQESRNKTLKKYVDKMSKAVDPKTAARWAQVEHALGAVVDLQIASELPLLR